MSPRNPRRTQFIGIMAALASFACAAIGFAYSYIDNLHLAAQRNLLVAAILLTLVALACSFTLPTRPPEAGRSLTPRHFFALVSLILFVGCLLLLFAQLQSTHAQGGFAAANAQYLAVFTGKVTTPEAQQVFLAFPVGVARVLTAWSATLAMLTMTRLTR